GLTLVKVPDREYFAKSSVHPRKYSRTGTWDLGALKKIGGLAEDRAPTPRGRRGRSHVFFAHASAGEGSPDCWPPTPPVDFPPGVIGGRFAGKQPRPPGRCGVLVAQGNLTEALCKPTATASPSLSVWPRPIPAIPTGSAVSPPVIPSSLRPT